jgi:hypothetical protein
MNWLRGTIVGLLGWHIFATSVGDGKKPNSSVIAEALPSRPITEEQDDTHYEIAANAPLVGRAWINNAVNDKPTPMYAPEISVGPSMLNAPWSRRRPQL